ncbi:hypothetical protein GUJ93_ZPchr0003g16944 [Zizania palustris]|uniref:Uncharacterized protein n=1 Tax=Zizania palustris TaxID=103762 RepID=A0A8J5S6M1_ZIZPA|nr:hypothetical protein GUJ93_ZPchr0003g16944 [Zizania palustris]
MDKFLTKNVSSRSTSSELCQEDAENMRGQQVLIDWVWNYFVSKRSDRLHSSQCIFITEDLDRALRSKAGWQRLVKRGVHILRKPHYQAIVLYLGT